MNEFILMNNLTEKETTRVAKIKTLYSELLECAVSGAQKAIQIGGELVEQKKECGRGKWEQWVKTNLPFGLSTAKNCIRCYSNRQLLANRQLTGDLPVDKFLMLIPKPTKEEQERIKVEANSKRNASRIKYAKKNAIPEVWQALEDEKISIDSADRIAHAPKKSQPEMLEAAIKITRPKPKAKPKTEPKLTSFERQQIGLQKAGYTSKPIGLTRQEVDPDFKGDDVAYAAEYGPVVMQTKQQRETERDRHTFSQWIGVVRKLKAPLKELLNAGLFSRFHITSWIKRTSDPSKYLMRYTDLEETLTLIKQAGESVTGHLEWLPSQKPVEGNGQ